MARPLTTTTLIPMLGRGWRFPMGRDGEAVAAAAAEASVRQSIEIIIATEKGERVMRPDFGCDLGKLLFAPNTGATQALAAFEVGEALKAWEPRIEVIEVTARADGEAGEELLIEVDYRVRSTDNRFNLVYPFYLDRALA